MPLITTTLRVYGVHSASCIPKLTKVFEDVAGIRSAQVTLGPPQVRIESEGPIDIDALDRAAHAAGLYAVREIEGGGTRTKVVSGRPSMRWPWWPWK